MQGSTQFQAAIGSYLDRRATDDPLFAQKYANKKKSLEECCRFILGEVCHSNRNGFEDDEIFGMAVHYYDEDNVEVKPNRIAKVVSNHCDANEMPRHEKSRPKQKQQPNMRFIQLDIFGDMEGGEQ